MAMLSFQPTSNRRKISIRLYFFYRTSELQTGWPGFVNSFFIQLDLAIPIKIIKFVSVVFYLKFVVCFCC